MTLKRRIKDFLVLMEYLFLGVVEKFFSGKVVYEITFTGGLGAQILSASLYMKLKEEGVSVCGDLSYFNNPYDNTGACTHWAWALSPYGYRKEDFGYFPINKKKKYFKLRIRDGLWKFRNGIASLRREQAINWFPVQDESVFRLAERFGKFMAEDALVVHIRRGDFVKLNLYIISEDEILDLIKKLSKITKEVFVLSDGFWNETSDFLVALKKHYPKVTIISSEEANEFDAHVIMRNAGNLIVANSQFSVSAGLLNNKNGLVLFPMGMISPIDCRYGREIVTNSKFCI